MKDRFDKGTWPRANEEYQRISNYMRDAQITGDHLQLVQERGKEQHNIPNTDNDPQYRRLNYVRYADVWVAGVRGSKAEAQEIINNISTICNHLELTMGQDKTITNINRDGRVFLGTQFQRSSSSQRRFQRRGRGWLRCYQRPLNLSVSLDWIRSKLHHSSYLKNGQPYPRYQWIPLNHWQILVLYNSVYWGFTNYYSFALNINDLSSLLRFVLKSSCAKLLAAKYSLSSQAKVYKRYGSSLTDPVSGLTFVKPEGSSCSRGLKRTSQR
jgi:hypothetical protein